MSFSGFQLKAKKTPFQKQKELEEERKKRDEAEAAKVYEDFVKEFGGPDDTPGPKAFVRGGVIEPGKPASSAGAASAGSKRHYVPSFVPPGMAAAAERDSAKQEEPVFQFSSAPRGKLRSIDLLLEDLKKGQAEREQRREQGLPDESDHRRQEDPGDGLTTNLFIGNLAPDLDESMVMREFGRFGAIGSVKIMWPRDEDQRRRGRNTGFVAFMDRKDAERAKDALDGITLHDLQLTIGWGKSVPLPSMPVWPTGEGGAAGMGGPAAAAPESTRQRMHDGPPPKAAVVGVGDDIQVQVPLDARQSFIIDATAVYVLRDGCEFEQAVMEHEQDNPEFAFLFDVASPEHAYYRWRLFSLASGDSLRSWRVDPFLMVERSNRWVPPAMTLAALAQRGGPPQRAERRDESTLSDLQRDKFERMLRALTIDRRSVCEAMVFALDNADAAADVAEVLTEALTLSETPVGPRVARLFLLSDILHNTSSSARNSSKYRQRLQDALPDVFESLQEAYRSAESRMSQEVLRKHVLKVLRVWRGWYIFSDDFVNGLQATFLRGGTGPAGTQSAACDAGVAVSAALAASLAAMTNDELELKCKHSGLSRRGARDAQIQRLLALDAYLTGTAGSGAGPQRTGLGAAEGSGVGRETLPPPSVPSSGTEPRNAEDEDRRQRLREVEVATLQFRDQLEKQGLPEAQAEAEAAQHRAKLLAAVGSRPADSSTQHGKRERSTSPGDQRLAAQEKRRR